MLHCKEELSGLDSKKGRNIKFTAIKDDLGLRCPMCLSIRHVQFTVQIVHGINLKSTLRSLLLANPGPTSTAISPHVRTRGKLRFAAYPCFDRKLLFILVLGQLAPYPCFGSTSRREVDAQECCTLWDRPSISKSEGILLDSGHFAACGMHF